ncbi:PLAT domain-containing protein [Aphelenchoides besseyi]|nr:PLAT domain-containing protein [Aphelenchoides besseyi]
MNFQLQSTTDHKMNAKIDEQSSLQLPSTAPLPVHVRPVRRLRSPSPNRPRTRQGTQDVIRQLRQTYSVVLRTECDVKMGAHANVFVQLTDSNGKQTDKCLLKRSITHTYKFCRGHTGTNNLTSERINSIDFLPCIPLVGWRCISTAEMDRALACGRTKDPVVHRGIRIERDSIPSFPSKSPITVITLLSVPLASRQNLIERGAMEMIQSMLCYHYAKEGRHTSEILELIQYLARILENQLPDAKKEQHKTECRAIVLQTLLKKRKLSDEQLAKFMIEMGKFVEVDKVDHVRQELWNEIRADQSDTIPLINLQRSVLGASKTPNRT